MTSDRDEFISAYRPADYPKAFTDRYEVVECLAASEQGETLIVRDRASGLRAVAKVMPAGREDREAGLLRMLSNPALPKLLDRYEGGAQELHVREYVLGTPLDEALHDRAMSEKEVVAIGVQLCDALIYLHSQKPPVIHRDIKPSNLILGDDGRLSLIDFGISREYDPDAEQDTFISGTNSYAPPEQYGFAQTDARADIYSAGMVLRFLLTRGDAGRRIGNRALRAVVARCTQFAPKERFASAQALKRALMTYRRRFWQRLGVCAASLALLCGLAVWAAPKIMGVAAGPVVWAEPAIESAARLALGKPEGELTRDELARVTELYLVQDTPAKDLLSFYELLNDYYAGRRPADPGSVNLLDDLLMLPNLRSLGLAVEQIVSIDAVSSLRGLERLELKHNAITDISPIARLDRLEYAGFTSNPLADLSPLAELPSLAELDLTFGALAADLSPIGGLGDLTYLSLSGAPLGYLSVPSSRIQTLRLSYSEIDSLERIAGVTGLQSLDVGHTKLKDLRGIERHSGLRELNIAGTEITDLSPLYGLRYLTRLTVSQGARVDASLFDTYFALDIAYE